MKKLNFHNEGQSVIEIIITIFVIAFIGREVYYHYPKHTQKEVTPHPATVSSIQPLSKNVREETFSFLPESPEHLVYIGGEKEILQLTRQKLYKPGEIIKKYKIGKETEILFYPYYEEKMVSYNNPPYNYSYYFKVYNKGKDVFTSIPENYTNLDIYQYKTNRYIIIHKPSGGAFCCFVAYIFYLDREDNITLIGDWGATTQRENLNERQKYTMDNSGIIEVFEKYGKIYLKVGDGRFHYFLGGSRPESFDIFQYILIDEKRIKLSNIDFKDEFLKKAKDDESMLNELIERETNQEKKGERKSCEFPILLGSMMANYILGGEEELAEKKIDFYFNKISSISQNYLILGERIITLNEIKKEIKKKIKVDCYSNV
jgi:hypothetical protein